MDDKNFMVMRNALLRTFDIFCSTEQRGLNIKGLFYIVYKNYKNLKNSKNIYEGSPKIST